MSIEIKKRIVVTGTGGFLGSNLLDAMKSRNDIHVFALSSHAKELQKTNKHKNIEFLHKDVLFSDCGKEILNSSILVNCAFPRNFNGKEIADGLEYLQRVFSRSKECGIEAIINISSQSVYSQVRETIATEETELSLDNAYAVGKYASELMLRGVCDDAFIKYTNLRMSSLIGPKFDQRIVNKMARNALEVQRITVNESRRRFGFLDVNDAVNAIIAVLDSDYDTWKEVYNVGNCIDYSALDIAKYVAEVYMEEYGAPVIIQKEVTDESGTTAVSGKLLQNDTSFIPKVSLKQSVQSIIHSLRVG